jgi:hypothetical protein
MENKSLSDILELSLELEKTAMRFYQELSNRSHHDEERSFWGQLARDEGGHLHFWNELIALAEAKKIRNLFDDLVLVYQELIRVRSLCKTLVQDDSVFADIGKSLMTAVRLEFHMLHPAFGAMFQLYESEVKKGPWPAAEYNRHLQFLMKGFTQFVSDRPESVLIGEMLQTIWRSNQQLARQLAEVRTLRGLIPICMHCRKIRDEEGFWVSVEKYVSSHTDADFSHGICEECLNKYYPDLA